MEPFELFKKTMGIINKYQEEKCAKDENKHTLNVDVIGKLLNEGAFSEDSFNQFSVETQSKINELTEENSVKVGSRLPIACIMLHDFINHLCDDCFQKEFPIAYAYDQLEINTEFRKSYHNCWEYSNSHDKNGNLMDKCKCCEKCEFIKASEKKYSYANELDHFLTRLLYEQSFVYKKEEDSKSEASALDDKKLEAGLLILAAEVMAKNVQNEEMVIKNITYECKLFYKAIKYGKASNEARIEKDNIQNILMK